MNHVFRIIVHRFDNIQFIDECAISLFEHKKQIRAFPKGRELDTDTHAKTIGIWLSEKFLDFDFFFWFGDFVGVIENIDFHQAFNPSSTASAFSKSACCTKRWSREKAAKGIIVIVAAASAVLIFAIKPTRVGSSSASKVIRR